MGRERILFIRPRNHEGQGRQDNSENTTADMSIFSNKSQPAPENKVWQLVPDHYGTYTLNRWDNEQGRYVMAVEKINREKAASKIQKLSRPVILIDGRNE